jgi:hypothetical protein
VTGVKGYFDTFLLFPLAVGRGAAMSTVIMLICAGLTA